MVRTLSIAAVLATALALPAIAEPTATATPSPQAAAGSKHTGNLFTEEQARVHLAKLGYESISGLEKDDNGGWRGTAVKDGKTVGVVVNVQGTVSPSATN